MAEERNLGIARAPQRSGEEESIEELQKRMELARDSISHTVTEIKETVANQVQAVKDTLDWREQFKKRPLAWSAGALGVGFVAGYSLAGAFKHNDVDYQRYSSYSGRVPLTGAQHQQASAAYSSPAPYADQLHERRGFVAKVRDSSAYETVSKEVSSLGDKFVKELASTAQLVILPFVLSKVKEWVGLDRLEAENAKRTSGASRPGTSQSKPRTDWSEPSTKPESTMGHS